MKLRSLSDLRQLLSDQPHPVEVPPSRRHDGKGKSIHISLDTKGRKGKSVTLISGLHHNPQTMQEIAHTLKERCGTGGTVKQGVIELQGDQRERAAKEMDRLNYRVTSDQRR